MKKQVMTGLVAVVIIVVAAAVFAFVRYGYQLGFAPTSYALAHMSNAEKAIALAKAPIGDLVTNELSAELKQAENKSSIDILDGGIPERLANLTPVTGESAEGMVRIVSTGTQLYVVFDESVSMTQGPSLRVYLAKRQPVTFDDFEGASVDLGELKSVRGTQVYAVPAEMTLDEIKAIAIVNVPYKAIMATAVIN
jgi:hypothetical protein